MSEKSTVKWFKDFIPVRPSRERDNTLVRAVAEKMIASGVKSPTLQSFENFLGLVCLERYAELTNQSLRRVVSEFLFIENGWPSDVRIQFAYLKQFSTLCDKLEYLYGGEFVCQGKSNQRKYLVLLYSAYKESITSYELSKALKISLQNASSRLKWYCGQGLFTREKVREQRRGRPTFIYKLTHFGKERASYLVKTMPLLPRKGTEESETYRLLKLKWDLRLVNLLKTVMKS